nr:MAG: putative capsid protein [Arizlama virus]
MARVRRFKKRMVPVRKVRRKFRRPKRTNQTAKLKIARSLRAFPSTKLVRHIYEDDIILPVGAAPGFISQWAFRANGMNDPNSTGVGHQPLYRDEYAALYKAYTVIASFITVTFDHVVGFNHHLIRVDTDGTSAGLGVSEINEQNNAHSAELIQRTRPLKLKKSYNAKRWYKTSLSGLMADDLKKTAVGSDPAEVVYFNIIRSPVEAALTVARCPARVRIIYICMWERCS